MRAESRLPDWTSYLHFLPVQDTFFLEITDWDYQS
jgi:hypothetical protein